MVISWFNPGKSNSSFDPSTKAAVIQFEKNGNQASNTEGVVDSVTLMRYLLSAIAPQTFPVTFL
ncbi:MAG: hypothetical protein PUP91_24130 [Rhizonema sp. PD37]|nr:hypothetical protein [Rhizonema sp. PD37]